MGKETDVLLTEIKKKYLCSQGFSKFDKNIRDKVNVLFYPKNKANSYINKLKQEIEKNKQKISKFLIEKLYCSNVNYDMYEFDGEKLSRLSKPLNTLKISFDEYLPYYYDTNGKLRKAAKLFYRLLCNDKKYTVEVRWKGNIHNASPQFQIHEE